MNHRIVAAALLVFVMGACTTTPVPDPAGPAPEPGTPDRPPAERTERRDPGVRIGVILTTSGSSALRQYGEAVLDGARVGADAGERDIELIVEDDGGTGSGAAAAMQRLEAAGVRAIVGPLTEDALTQAVGARQDGRIALISPMAISDPAGPRNVYAMNVVDGRGAAALGEYARRFDRIGVLHARTPDGERQAQAFIDAYGGGGTLTRASYQSGSANLVNEITRLRGARIQALYVPGNVRELQVVLPQIEYAGLSAVQILGSDSFIGDAARALPQRMVQGAIVATPLIRDSRELAWLDFVAAYEARYRRSLQSAVPALGYDAVRLAAALVGGDNDIARFRGATGLITLRDDTITRHPFLVRIEAGRLIPVN